MTRSANRPTENALKAASFCEGMSSSLILAFLPYYVHGSLGETSYSVAMCILALPAIALFAVNNFWGAFVDSTGRIRMAERIGLAGFTVCLLSVCLVERSFGVIAAAAGLSLLYGALRPTLLSHATLLHEKTKATAISGILLLQSAGWFVAGPLFGHLYDPAAAWSPWVIFGAPALLCLGVALFLPRWVEDPPISQAARPFGTVLKEGLFKVLLGDLESIYRNKELFRICIVVFVVSTSNWCFFGMFSFIYREEMSGSLEALGWTLALSTAMAMSLFPFIGRFIDRRGGRVGLLGSILLYIGFYTAVAFIHDSRIASVLFVIPIYPLFLVSGSALAADATRSDQRAGGLGVMAGVFALAQAAGGLLGGAIGDFMSLRKIVVAAAFISCLSLLLFVLLVGLEKRRPVEESEAQ